jgi:Flp pilus assembly protein TadG
MKRLLFHRTAKFLPSFIRNSDATAAVETAIFAPIFLIMTLGITDLGTGMFARMTINGATQAGAAFAVFNSNSGLACDPAGSWTTCFNGIKSAMNDAFGSPSFCTGSVCTASPTCVSGSGKCITVTANYPYTPILPITSGYFASSWDKSMTVSSTVTIRIE